MKNENSKNQNESPHKRKSRKRTVITWVLIGLAAFVLLIFFGTPLYLSSSGGTNLLLGRINQAVDGQVKMDDFSIGWFKGVKLTNLSYADTAGQTAINVQRIETHPQYISLLGGKVKLGKTMVEKPQVYLKVSAPESRKKPAPEEEEMPAPAAALGVDQIDLEVIDGAATIELVDDISQKVQFANIASKVQIAQGGQSSSVDLSMNVNEQSEVSAKGTASTGKKGWTLKESDFEVQVSKLQLADLKPLFALAGQPMDMAGELNADATIQVKDGTLQRLEADAKITDFAQGTGEQRTVFEKPVIVSALLTGDKGAVQIDRATVQSSFCTVDCSGTLQSLDYQVDADLAQTRRFAGQFVDMQELNVEGRLTANGKVNLTDERIGVTGDGAAKGLVVKKNGIQTPATDVQMQFDGAVDKAAGQFQLASANVTATPGTVNLSNLVLPMSADAQKNVSLDARAQLDLAKTWPFLQVFADLPEDVLVAGALNSTVNVTTEGSQIRLLTDDTQIEHLKITQPDNPPFQQEKVSLNGDILLDTDNQTIDIRTLDLQAADGESLIKISEGQIKKKVSQDTTHLSGDFEAYYDLTALSSMASVYLPQGLTMEGKRTDTLHFDSQYPTDQPDLMPANLNADATFGFTKAEYMGLNVGAAEMKVDVVNGLLDLTIPETTVNEGKMQLAGTIDLSEQPRLFRLKEAMPILQNVQVNDTLTRNLLMYTNPVFADAVRASGIASFSCEQMAIPLSKEQLSQMTIEGTLGIESLKLQAGDFLGQILSLVDAPGSAMMTIHPTNFNVQNGFLSYQDMQLDVGSTPVHFAGKIGLDKSLAMTVKVPVRDRTIPLPLSGSLTNPKLDTGKLGQELIEQEVQHQLRRLFE